MWVCFGQFMSECQESLEALKLIYHSAEVEAEVEVEAEAVKNVHALVPGPDLEVQMSEGISGCVSCEDMPPLCTSNAYFKGSLLTLSKTRVISSIRDWDGSAESFMD